MGMDYYFRDSFFHRLDPRSKLIWAFTYMLGPGVYPDAIIATLFFLTVAVIIIVAKIPWRKMKPFYAGIAIPAALYVLMNVWYNRGPTVYASLLWGNYVVTLEGLLFGIRGMMAFLIILSAVRVLTLCTSPSELVLGFVKFRMPKEYGVALTIGFSYIPVLISAIRGIMDAQRARGWQFAHRNPIKRARALVPTLVPTIMMSVERATALAAAIESKGFGHDISRRTYYLSSKFRTSDYVFCTINLILLFVTIAAITFGWGSTFTYDLIKSIPT